MSRYIDADRLMAIFENRCDEADSVEAWLAYVRACEDVRDFPAADVVEVVRCKDCKWFEKWYKELPPYDTGFYCTRPNQQSANLLPTDFCSYVVKRNE